ncbi:MAG: hypothetical protein PHF60_04825 [Candidatus ainarchaeum sp.]|nr:hypothetical protein [Candidatus ainarchaeum sp.]
MTKSKQFLPDGRTMRATNNISQLGMFLLQNKQFDPMTEHIANARDFLAHDYGPTGWLRGDQYVFYRSNPVAPLGKELVYDANYVTSLGRRTVGEITSTLIIPDIPVTLRGKTMSLQAATMVIGVLDSITLLEIIQTGGNEFLVAPAKSGALAGKVKLVDISSLVDPNVTLQVFPAYNTPSCMPDEHGFPTGVLVPEGTSGAVTLLVNTFSTPHATGSPSEFGWHGSASFHASHSGVKSISCGLPWETSSDVILLGNPGTQSQQPHQQVQ